MVKPSYIQFQRRYVRNTGDFYDKAFQLHTSSNPQNMVFFGTLQNDRTTTYSYPKHPPWIDFIRTTYLNNIDFGGRTKFRKVFRKGMITSRIRSSDNVRQETSMAKSRPVSDKKIETSEYFRFRLKYKTDKMGGRTYSFSGRHDKRPYETRERDKSAGVMETNLDMHHTGRGPMEAVDFSKRYIQSLQELRLRSASFQNCVTSADCRKGMECFQFAFGVFGDCSPTAIRCWCKPSGNFKCTSKEECSTGEECKFSRLFSDKICASNMTIKSEPWMFFADRDGEGLNFDRCKINEDCAGLRACVSSDDVSVTCPSNDLSCGCLPTDFVPCGSNEDCNAGEKCVPSRLFDHEICISNLAFENHPFLLFAEDEGNGLNFDNCEVTSDCAGARACVSFSNDAFVVCPSHDPSCWCLPAERLPCKSNEDCDPGEKCAPSRASDDKICVSINAFERNPFLFSPVGKGKGLNFDDCSVTDECAGQRACVSIVGDLLVICQAHETACWCGPPVDPYCTSDEDCTLGEKCLQEIGIADVCVSKLALAKGSEHVASIEPDVEQETAPVSHPNSNSSGKREVPFSNEGVCVDATALNHLDRQELVFRDHILTFVLCDKAGSCATPGHLVEWNGKGMMMKTYCSIIGGCAQKKMLVNSPAWKPKIKIASKTDGLFYTAFAAKHTTRFEEMVLSTVLLIGF